jgi:POT family proton-dependent oligopeptide transporter
MSTATYPEIVDHAPPAPPDDTGGIGGHPRGLTTLFFTELWERFSYYGMRAILVLYMVAPAADGGLGLDTQRAASIYGTYTMAVYLMAIPGGFVADRFIGARLAVLVGGVVIALGHFSMAVPLAPLFYLGLVLIVFGTGLLKPNISQMVGSLYGPDDPRRDGGFSIFYMGINLGAALSPIVCGFLAQSPAFKSVIASAGLDPSGSWHWGFAAAGVGMTLGLAQFIAHRRRIAHVGGRPARRASARAAAPPEPLSREEWRRIGAIFVLFAFTVLFWSVYEQAGSSLTLFADRLTDNRMFGWEFPSSWYQSVQAVFVIALAPVYSVMWFRLGDRQPASPIKFAVGLFFLGVGTVLMVPAAMLSASGRVSPLWLVGVYFLQVVGELFLSPVGLSTVTRLAPPRLVGLMMGVWFLASSLGNKIAGYLGGFFDEGNTSLMVQLFGSMAVASVVAAGVLVALAPMMRRLMGGVR